MLTPNLEPNPALLQERDLVESFAAMPREAQAALFLMLNRVIGMDAAEKTQAAACAAGATYGVAGIDPVSASLFSALASFVMTIDDLAKPPQHIEWRSEPDGHEA